MVKLLRWIILLLRYTRFIYNKCRFWGTLKLGLKKINCSKNPLSEGSISENGDVNVEIVDRISPDYSSSSYGLYSKSNSITSSYSKSSRLPTDVSSPTSSFLDKYAKSDLAIKENGVLSNAQIYTQKTGKVLNNAGDLDKVLAEALKNLVGLRTHRYHLVDFSPHPYLVSLSTFILLFGFVCWFNFCS